MLRAAALLPRLAAHRLALSSLPGRAAAASPAAATPATTTLDSAVSAAWERLQDSQAAHRAAEQEYEAVLVRRASLQAPLPAWLDRTLGSLAAAADPGELAALRGVLEEGLAGARPVFGYDKGRGLGGLFLRYAFHGEAVELEHWYCTGAWRMRASLHCVVAEALRDPWDSDGEGPEVKLELLELLAIDPKTVRLSMITSFPKELQPLALALCADEMFREEWKLSFRLLSENEDRY